MSVDNQSTSTQSSELATARTIARKLYQLLYRVANSPDVPRREEINDALREFEAYWEVN